jgi:hypothetical protein
MLRFSWKVVVFGLSWPILMAVQMMIVGALWLLAVLAAQVTCSLVPFIPPQCQKSDLDVWGMPFLTAPIGFPCLLVRLWSSLSPRRGNACRNLNLFLESASPAN